MTATHDHATVTVDVAAAALVRVCDLVEPFAFGEHPDGWTVEQQADVWALMQHTVDAVAAAARKFGEHIAGSLSVPVWSEHTGSWVSAQTRVSRTGWDTDAVRAAITRWANKADTPAETVDRIWQAATPATGRTRVLRDTVGIDPDDYCSTRHTRTLALTETPPPNRRPEQ